MTERQTITTLQVGRAVAAIGVVFFHANSFFLPERLYPGLDAGRSWNMGYAGVEYFFVLSGFIMVLSHGHEFGRTSALKVFLLKRFTRIVPFYWIVMVILVGLLIFQFGVDAARLGEGGLLYSFSLVPNPDGTPFLIHSAWTLSHEMMFYAVFSLMFLSLRWGAVTFLIWQFCIVLAQFAGGLTYPFDFLLSAYNLLFLIGIVAALSFRRIPLILAWAAALGGAALFFAIGLLDVHEITRPNHAARTFLFGLAAYLIVSGFAALERLEKVRGARFLVYLGDASYAIYLVHGIVLAIASKILISIKLSTVLPPLTLLMILVVLAVASGCFAHTLVERPILARLRRFTTAVAY